ncbi:MAG: class I SAM-dependent methyltransferase [Roseovarius sp.]|nr:class I SAM-dependent methyltransferase [Roseovarius sp.]
MIAADNPFFGGRDLRSVEASGFNSTLIERIGKYIPQPSLDLGRAPVESALRAANPTPTGICLIIGAGSETNFLTLLRALFAEVVVTDVVQGPPVQVICDGADLPFPDNHFDCVVAMAVLEHVLEPEVVVAQMHRVLKPGGMVVADTPFMQQVHMRAYDFTRFTDLGHRWLLRNFTEVDRGVSVGPGSALAWSLMYFVRSFTRGGKSVLIAQALVRLLFFWLKYFDLLLGKRPGGRDAAAGFYFVGTKSDGPGITAQNIIQDFRGLT